MILAGFVSLYALAGIAAGIAVSRITPDTLTRLRERLARGRNAYLVVGLGVMFAFGFGLRPEWVYAHTALMLGASFVLVDDLLYADERPITRVWFIIGGVVAAAATFVRAYALGAYPAPQVTDEGWVFAWVVGYLKTGHFSDYLMYYGGHDVQRYYLPMAWWMQIVGIGWWQGRLFNLIVSLPLIALSGLAARNLFGRAAGWLTAIFLFVSAVVVVGMRLRHDMGLGLAIAACLWAYSAAIRRGSKPLHFLAGALIGLGLFAHYHATGFGIALALGLYLPRYFQRIRQGNWRPEIGLILFGLGGLVGAGIVVVFQIIPDWQGFLATRELRNPPNLTQYLDSTLGHINSIAAHSQLELILIGVGLAAALWRRRVNDLAIAISAILAHLILAIMATDTWDHYPMPLTPLYAMLVATLFTDGFKRVAEGAVTLKNAVIRQRTAFAFLCFALVSLGFTLHTPISYTLAREPIQPPPPPAAQYVLDHYDPATTLVTAEHYYYLFMWHYRFASVLTPNLMPRDKYAEFGTVDAVWDSIAPNVVILDRNLATCCVPPIMTTDYLTSRGYQVVAQFDGAQYPVFVYAKDKPHD
ncbi:MAG: glycosyltransferase family 39 protein [Chloroflexota bacterium]